MLENSIRVNDQPGFAMQDAQTAKLKLKDFYLSQNKTQKASEILNQVGTFLSTENKRLDRNGDILKSWLKARNRYSEMKGDDKNALTTLRAYQMLNDSLELAERSAKRTDFDRGIENAERRYQLLNLERDSERKSLYLYGSMVLLVLVLLIVFLLIKYRQKDRKNLKALRDLNIQIRHSLEALEESQQENNDMLQVIAHDLRNPVSGMMMAASTLAYLSPPTEKDKPVYELIQQSGEEAIHMISELLESRTKVGDLKLQSADIYEILYYSVKMLEPKAREKDIAIHLKSVKVSLLLNREKIWRMLGNLIGNAIKFSDAGQEILITASQRGEGIAISIADRGIGLPAHSGQEIFNNRGKIGSVGTHGEPSYGLGLAIAKQIVDAHAGKIWFEANNGGGTIFWVWLPMEND